MKNWHSWSKEPWRLMHITWRWRCCYSMHEFESLLRWRCNVFLHGLKYNIKGIVRHHQYNTMNELLHHAREAESQLAKETQVKA
jgi:hypothetical protein